MAFQTLDPSPIGVKLRGKIFGLALVPTEGELAEPGGQQHHHVRSGTVGATLQRTEAVLTTTPLSNGRATIRRRPIRSDGGGRKSLLHKRRITSGIGTKSQACKIKLLPVGNIPLLLFPHDASTKTIEYGGDAVPIYASTDDDGHK